MYTMEYKCRCRYAGINSNTFTNVMVEHTQIHELVPSLSTFHHNGLFRDLEDFVVLHKPVVLQQSYIIYKSVVI